MRLLTLRLGSGDTARTTAVRQDGDTLTEVTGFSDVGALLQDPAWETTAKAANGATHALDGADLAVVPSPGKIICVGHNYRKHIKEIGGEVPEYPTLFAKYAESLIGPNEDRALPQESDAVDWEAELAVVSGKAGRRISEADAKDHIRRLLRSQRFVHARLPVPHHPVAAGQSPPRSARPWSPRTNSLPGR